jgi:hypothetical protein
MARPLFPLGRVVSTPGALETFNHDFILDCIQRHMAGDWGTVDKTDRAENDWAVNNEARILSAYEQDGKRLWVITESDRSSTCVMLPSEY